jgi:membrane associated rhomboid family serine protease
MIGGEVLFAVVDAGLLPETLGRGQVFYRYAFLDLAFDAWRGQVVVRDLPPGEDLLRLHTFLTHAFLHGGWLHLALNGAAFLGLGHALVQSMGIGRFLVTFVVTAMAGALAFGLIAEAVTAMVGASGAIFGFLAMITA